MGFQDVGLRHFLSNAEVTKGVIVKGGRGGGGYEVSKFTIKRHSPLCCLRHISHIEASGQQTSWTEYMRRSPWPGGVAHGDLQPFRDIRTMTSSKQLQVHVRKIACLCKQSPQYVFTNLDTDSSCIVLFWVELRLHSDIGASLPVIQKILR